MAVRDYMSHSVKGCTQEERLAVHDPDDPAQARLLDLHGREHRRQQLAGHRRDATSSAARPRRARAVTGPRPAPRRWPRSRRCGCAARATATTSWPATTGSAARPGIAATAGSSSPASSPGAAPSRSTAAAPSVGSLSGNDSLRRTDKATFSASFGDGFRLSDGSVQIDGSTKSGWSYDLNVTTDTRQYTVDAASLSTGTHTLTWRVRDVAGHVTSEEHDLHDPLLTAARRQGRIRPAAPPRGRGRGRCASA